MQNIALKSINLFFTYTTKQSTESTIKQSTFVDWQTVCLIPKIKLKSGIKKVPPPIPIPAKTPDKHENVNNNKICKIFLLFSVFYSVF